MRLVVDCNVIIAAGWNSGTARAVIKEVIANHIFFVSSDIVEEYVRVINYSKFDHIKNFLYFITHKFLKAANSIEPSQGCFGFPDSADEVYLATALACKADAIITGNKKHFPTDKCQGISILSPREFLDLISANSN